MSIKTLFFIISIFLFGNTQAADLEDSLKELQLKLGQLKGKLGILKTSLSVLKANISIVPLLENAKNDLNKLSAPTGNAGLPWSMNKGTIVRTISKITHALKSGMPIQMSDLEKITDLEKFLEDNLGANNSIIKIAKEYTAEINAAAPPKVTIVTPQLVKESDITVNLRNSLKQFMPTKVEFNADKDSYFSSFCMAICKYTKEEIKSTTELFKGSVQNYENENSNKKVAKLPGLANFQNNIDNFADFFIQLYLDKFFENTDNYNDCIIFVNVFFIDIDLRNAVVNFLEACKIFYNKYYQKDPTGKTKDSDFATKLDTKYAQLEKSRVAAQKGVGNLIILLDSYTDTQVLTFQEINNILKGNSLGNLKNFGKKAYHDKAQKIINNSVNLKYFKDNYVDSRTGKTNDALRAFEKELNEHSCIDVVSHLNTIKEQYKDEVSNEQKIKNQVIDDILTHGLHERDDLEKKTLVNLNQLLGRLKLLKAPISSNPLSGPPPPPPPPLSGMKPPPPPPPPL